MQKSAQVARRAASATQRAACVEQPDPLRRGCRDAIRPARSVRGPTCCPCDTRSRPSSPSAVTAGMPGSRSSIGISRYPDARSHCSRARRVCLDAFQRSSATASSMREFAAAGPSQRLEARPRAQPAPRGMGERPHVEAGRAGECDARRVAVEHSTRSARDTRTGTGVQLHLLRRAAPSRRPVARQPSSPRTPAAPAGTRPRSDRKRVVERVTRQARARIGRSPSPVTS